MKYEEQKNRTMKTFEEIYRDAAVRNGCNAGKTFARVMFEEGMSQNLVNPEKPDVPLNKNDAFQKVQKTTRTRKKVSAVLFSMIKAHRFSFT